MVALQTSDPDRSSRTTRPNLQVIEGGDAPKPTWSSTHPAVRARMGQLHAVQRLPTPASSSLRGSGGLVDAAPPVDERVVPGGTHRFVYLRRRAVAALLLLALLWAVVAAAGDVFGGSSNEAGASQALTTRVVVPGDTWWSLANELDRPGDIRDTVASLVELNDGEQLLVGQRVVLPAG